MRKGAIFICEGSTMEEEGRRAKYNGIVYGYYGPLWEANEWYLLMESMHLWGINFILYGPKHDPFHREKWRLPNPEKEALFMKELIHHAQTKGTE